jgi:hypothetical protein
MTPDRANSNLTCSQCLCELHSVALLARFESDDAFDVDLENIIESLNQRRKIGRTTERDNYF